MVTLTFPAISRSSKLIDFSLELPCCNSMPTSASSPYILTGICKTEMRSLVEFYHTGPTPISSHTNINPVLSSASLNNLFKPCLREASAVTSEGWCAKVWFAANRKIYFFQFQFCHTRTVVFPTRGSFFCNNHRDDRSQVAIWAVWVEWRLLVLWPLVQNGLVVSTAQLNEDG